MYIQASVGTLVNEASCAEWEGDLEQATAQPLQVSLNRKIKNYILRSIDRGEWKEGHRVPSEMELARAFAASRMTVNRAIRELTEAGRLERVQGLGTFVASGMPMAPLFEIRSIAREIDLRNGIHSCEVIEAATISASCDAASLLGLSPGEPVFRLVAVHRCDGTPLQFERRLVNPALAPEFLMQDFTCMTASDYLLQHVPFTKVEHLVDAMAPSPDVASLLEIRGDEPCLRLVRTTWHSRRRITHVELIHPGPLFRLGGRFTAAGAGCGLM
ncbi:histidine utilization repressor [Mesorhizobium sp. CAU 1741]|uniref:histidine utilization repressor n=1 Tax=Mesorhizobium sp. CAU 1741 TaxID=3140366 RepID=UPI00325A55B2